MKSLSNLTEAQLVKISLEQKRKKENGQIILVILGFTLSGFAFLGALFNNGKDLNTFDFFFTYGAPFILGILTIGFAIVCKYENK